MLHPDHKRLLLLRIRRRLAIEHRQQRRQKYLSLATLWGVLRWLASHREGHSKRGCRASEEGGLDDSDGMRGYGLDDALGQVRWSVECDVV